MLLDPFEKQFHLSSSAMQFRYGYCRQGSFDSQGGLTIGHVSMRPRKFFPMKSSEMTTISMALSSLSFSINLMAPSAPGKGSFRATFLISYVIENQFAFDPKVFLIMKNSLKKVSN
jgi:hypothetical protein